MLQQNELLNHIVQVISILANPGEEAAVHANPGSPMGFTIISGGDTSDIPVSQTTTRNQAIKQAFEIYDGQFDKELDEEDAHLMVFEALANSFTDAEGKRAVAEYIMNVDRPESLVQDLPQDGPHGTRGRQPFMDRYSAQIDTLAARLALDSVDSYLAEPNAGKLLIRAANAISQCSGTEVADGDVLQKQLTGKWEEAYKLQGEPLAMVEDGLMNSSRDSILDETLVQKWRGHIDALAEDGKRDALQRAIDEDMGLLDEAQEKLNTLNNAPVRSERTAMMQQMLENLSRAKGGGAPGNRPVQT